MDKTHKNGFNGFNDHKQILTQITKIIQIRDDNISRLTSEINQIKREKVTYIFVVKNIHIIFILKTFKCFYINMYIYMCVYCKDKEINELRNEVNVLRGQINELNPYLKLLKKIKQEDDMKLLKQIRIDLNEYTKNKLDNLLVYGYVRNEFRDGIPNDIIPLIYKYYSIKISFDTKCISRNAKIMENNGTFYHTGLTSEKYVTCFGENIISKDMLYNFVVKFKIIRHVNIKSHIRIGLIEANQVYNYLKTRCVCVYTFNIDLIYYIFVCKYILINSKSKDGSIIFIF